ncbi:hypothetical protein CVS47_02839 [Microbacterium lemovicicum]|uniref:Uncharacterized protein n=1 Tax=Microbacterium lemovicicum TaxID=1072463 RepID=A0A3Q9J319_9MICO|nr:hypothetical protein [Microbacterium lemovicicum]AZS38188.1 hypothetical protein CVS47_02839 [Microbacterium lemovicicum]
MNTNNLLAVDHARAAAVAVAVATGDDAMALLAISEAAEDVRDESLHALVIACGVSLVQMLHATIGLEAAEQLLRKTLLQLRTVAETEG